jgi:hypothetical protein
MYAVKIFLEETSCALSFVPSGIPFERRHGGGAI